MKWTVMIPESNGSHVFMSASDCPQYCRQVFDNKNNVIVNKNESIFANLDIAVV